MAVCTCSVDTSNVGGVVTAASLFVDPLGQTLHVLSGWQGPSTCLAALRSLVDVFLLSELTSSTESEAWPSVSWLLGLCSEQQLEVQTFATDTVFLPAVQSFTC